MRTALATLPLSLLFSLLASTASPQAPTGDAARGRSLYQSRCTACHAVDHPGVGPQHRGVFGRLAGTAPGFNGYSAALQHSGLVWNAANLERWLTDPERLVPGQAMGVSVPDAAERADLIAYLRTLSPNKKE